MRAVWVHHNNQRCNNNPSSSSLRRSRSRSRSNMRRLLLCRNKLVHQTRISKGHPLSNKFRRLAS
jgi:hypothetical protein